MKYRPQEFGGHHTYLFAGAEPLRSSWLFCLVAFALAILQGGGDVGGVMRPVPSRSVMVRPTHERTGRPLRARVFVEMPKDQLGRGWRRR